MCEKCRQKHTKIFWLDQIREMEWIAKELVKAGGSKNPVIDTEIWLFKQGHSPYKTKEDLVERVFEIIKGMTTPREHSGPKYKEQDIFSASKYKEDGIF